MFSLRALEDTGSPRILELLFLTPQDIPSPGEYVMLVNTSLFTSFRLRDFIFCCLIQQHLSYLCYFSVSWT
jgi:hypothetical protein